jgi:metal-sulfur cluster biosynthetic enzyme
MSPLPSSFFLLNFFLCVLYGAKYREYRKFRIDIADDRTVKVDMSLTSPNCPSAQELPMMVQNAVSTVPGVGKVDVSVVWDPPWDPSRMSEEARVVLNML